MKKILFFFMSLMVSAYWCAAQIIPASNVALTTSRTQMLQSKAGFVFDYQARVNTEASRLKGEGKSLQDAVCSLKSRWAGVAVAEAAQTVYKASAMQAVSAMLQCGFSIDEAANALKDVFGFTVD